MYLKVSQRQLTSAWENRHKPEGHENTDIQQHHEYKGHTAQDVVICEEDERLHEAEGRSQIALQSKVLLPHWWPACRVLTHMHM